MATPYLYEASDGSVVEREFPMGTAPHALKDAALGELRRTFDNATFRFTYGKEDFHGPTIGERQEQQLRDFPNAEPCGARWV